MHNRLLVKLGIILISCALPLHGYAGEYKYINEIYGDLSELRSIFINNDIILSDNCKTDYDAVIKSKNVIALIESCKLKDLSFDISQPFSKLEYERLKNENNELVQKYLYNYLIVNAVIRWYGEDYHSLSQIIIMIVNLLNNSYVTNDAYIMNRYIRMYQDFYHVAVIYDLIGVIDNQALDKLEESLSFQEKHLAVVRIETIEQDIGTFINGEYSVASKSKNGITKSDLNSYANLSFINRKEYKNIENLLLYVKEYLGNDGCFRDYKDYNLLGGGMLPGRKLYKGVEGILKLEMRLQDAHNKRKLALLLGLAVHKYYSQNESLPIQLEDIYSQNMFNSSNIQNYQMFNTSEDIDYNTYDNCFVINVGDDISPAGVIHNESIIFRGYMREIQGRTTD